MFGPTRKMQKPSGVPFKYLCLGALRIALVFAPQLGYIHPDEFFQSVEILAGNVFEIESNPPWEFNSTFPIRSMALPYFTVGMSYKILKLVNQLGEGFFPSSIVTPYTLLVIPRLLMAMSSFLIDYSLWKICSNNNEKFKSRLIVLSSSYVILIYGSRTFSNTMEMVLFALLLYYVAESLIFSNILNKKRDYLNYRYDTSTTTVEKVKFHKLKLYLATDLLRNCVPISIITVVGFFNRPTFVLFALFPVFFWLYRGIGCKSESVLNFHWRIFIFASCCVPWFIVIIIVDSFYYGYLTWGEVGIMDLSLDNFVFTPLNFVKYNLDSGNLAEHGLHPRSLHVMVNVPLLFNVLAVRAFLGFVQYAQNIVQGKHHLLPTVRSIKGLMALSTVAPVALLSAFPHQEPRFLIPIVTPLVYLYATWIFPEAAKTVAKTQTNSKKPTKTTKTPPKKNSLMKLWLVLNSMLALFYGFVHQGGVYQVANFLSKDLAARPTFTEYHIVTSHVYMMPQSLLMQRQSDRLYFTKNIKYAINRRVFMYEEGSSSSVEQVAEKIRGVFDRCEHLKRTKPNKKYRVFLVMPSSLDDGLGRVKTGKGLAFSEPVSFYPHVSTEALPDLVREFAYVFGNFQTGDVGFYLFRIASGFGLNLYEIKLA